jgi:zinc protease
MPPAADRLLTNTRPEETPMSSRWLALPLVLLAASPVAAATPGGYAVVVKGDTLNKPGWKEVVNALVDKHGAWIATYDKLDEARVILASKMPRYACFVATPEETTRDFVAQVHRVTRTLDDDPYTDVIWGILTGYDAANALRIAKCSEPLEIKRCVAGTEVALQACPEGIWFSEGEAGKVVRKAAGGEPVVDKGPTDSTKSIVDALNDGKADIFITSGHATERDWQIGYKYKNGQFRCKGGQLFGLDTKREKFPINSPNPKVYLAVGNCLMGHIDNRDAMALAFMNSGGVNQMIGYTELTWFGYGGWGCLDYFFEQPGRFTLAEAFYANQQALLHVLETKYPDLAKQENGRRSRNGYLYDRDAVAFYGDPAWSVKMAPGPMNWDQELTEKDGVFTFTVKPKKGDKTFAPISTNGSERGGRPIFAFLPHRVKNVTVTEGSDLKPVITDNFLLLPQPEDGSHPYRVVFKAEAGR